MTIEHFRDEYFFLSSMYPVKIETPEGNIVPALENAYQAEKFIDEVARGSVLGAADGFKAKKIANGLEKTGAQVRPDWDFVKVEIMRNYNYQKFSVHEKLGGLLLATGNEEIVEGNNRNDTFWGVDPPGSDNGLNWLGRILMETRQALRVKNN